MSEVESKAMRRATLLLLALSGARFLAAGPADGPQVAGEATRGHAETTRAAADEGERRARPLQAGETIDPNDAAAEELDRLPGVGPATADAIVAARARGVVFRRPEDLQRVRGLGPASIDRLRAFLDLSEPPAGNRRPVAPARERSQGRSGPTPETLLNVNRASAEELVQLPGIGPVIAARLVEERGKGAFSSLDDLTRVRGIGPATVDRLRGLVVAR